MGSLRDAWTELRRTVVVVAVTFVAFGLTVGVSLALRSTGPAGDTVVKTTNFHISMPTKLRAGRHTFAYTNDGAAPHEFLLFRTDRPGNALPLRADGNGAGASHLWLRSWLQAQLLARNTSTPSFIMMGTMSRLATGSAHHHLSSAFNSKPPSRIAER